MVTRCLSSVRAEFGRSIASNRWAIVVEMLAVTLLPVSLTLLQASRTIIPLFVLGWLSLWLRHKRWKDVGLYRPTRWPQVTLAGSGMAVAGVYLSKKAIAPLLLQRTGETQPPVIELVSLPGNLVYFLLLLIGIWLLAAIGEEAVYRGYVLNRLVDLLGHGKVGWGIGLVVSSIMFSMGHGLFSRSVILGGSLIGLIEGGLYLASRRNLWLSIVFHGTWDTVFLVLHFLGLSWR